MRNVRIRGMRLGIDRGTRPGLEREIDLSNHTSSVETSTLPPKLQVQSGCLAIVLRDSPSIPPKTMARTTAEMHKRMRRFTQRNGIEQVTGHCLTPVQPAQLPQHASRYEAGGMRPTHPVSVVDRALKPAHPNSSRVA